MKREREGNAHFSEELRSLPNKLHPTFINVFTHVLSINSSPIGGLYFKDWRLCCAEVFQFDVALLVQFCFVPCAFGISHRQHQHQKFIPYFSPRVLWLLISEYGVRHVSVQFYAFIDFTTC